MSQGQLPDIPPATGSRKPVAVSVAVMVRGDGQVLLARRPASKVYAGYWEFPGGKVEPGETDGEALAREIQEELGVEITRAWPWVTQVYAYPHATVRLKFFRVTGWTGEPRAKEHDAIIWQPPGAIDLEPLLPANGPVLRGLTLPHEYAISDASSLGEEAFAARLQARFSAGLRLLQVREIDWPRERMASLVRRAIELGRPHGARVLVNNDIALAHHSGAHGVHLTARQLSALGTRPDMELVGASCHNRAELEAAQELGADFAVLGPVCRTPSHPEREAMGWDAFAALVSEASLPVFALGGVHRGDMERAWTCGAHGVAMLRGAWSRD